MSAVPSALAVSPERLGYIGALLPPDAPLRGVCAVPGDHAARRYLFAAAQQTVFLNAEIVQLALIGQEHFRFDELLANHWFFIREQLGEFQAAERVDARFERWNAQQPPFGVRQ
jgi:hypothetical protein